MDDDPLIKSFNGRNESGLIHSTTYKPTAANIFTQTHTKPTKPIKIPSVLGAR
jgi:hypothetical protein